MRGEPGNIEYWHCDGSFLYSWIKYVSCAAAGLQIKVYCFQEVLQPPSLLTYANNFAVFSMRLATATPKGHRVSQPLQPIQSFALAESCS